jgi:hypothetical protein
LEEQSKVFFCNGRNVVLSKESVNCSSCFCSCSMSLSFTAFNTSYEDMMCGMNFNCISPQMMKQKNAR